MNYKIYLYIFFILLSAFAVSGLDLEKILRRNKIVEAKILAFILSIVLGYLMTNFVIDFISLSKVI